MERGGRQGGKDEEDPIDDTTAKHLLDSIGKIVHKKVKSESEAYKEALTGDLKKAATASGETGGTNETCDLVKQYYNKRVNEGGGGNGDPCNELGGKVQVNRFSDKIGGQCTDSKIKGNKNNCGACAPFRRLHLCHHNLETINNTTPTASDTLLLEVCMAAKYEGKSITGYYPIYQTIYKDYGSTICTVLARSFADIGDIVRGKDPFYGNPEEIKQRQQLEDKLKEIFQKIHDDVTKTNGKTNWQTLKKRYEGDTADFLKLREDWWTANRNDVWKALTCDDDNKLSNASYFRETCAGGTSPTPNKCRCSDNQVPTYFDYVPQFLRWFEEWAEDFCRLRKHKLKDAIQKCREKDKGDKKLYCDLNRHDCVKTIRGDHDFVEEDDCKDCQYSCAYFVKWIDNQKLEFLKQRNKYQTEIQTYTNGTVGSGSGRNRKKRGVGGATTTNYDGYESKFYKKMKEKKKYVKVGEFLDLLKKEEVCTKFSEDEGNIDFKTVKSSSAKNSDGNNKTFSHTKYCQACPWCGGKWQNGKWEDKQDTECEPAKGYNDYKKTEIPILTGDKTKSDMVKKYKKFCANDEKSAAGTANGGGKGKNGDNITETWTCYYKEKNNNDGKKEINFCVQQKQDTDKKKEYSMHYNAFFWKWVHDMLIDSIKWRNELGSCIDNAKSEQCKNKQCRKNCDCFAKWVNEKKTEWKNIKIHFGKQDFGNQEDMGNNALFGSLFSCPSYVLKTVLNIEDLFNNIKSGYGNVKDIERIEKMLQQAGVASDLAALGGECIKGPVAEQDTTIDKILQHEKDEAEKCKKCEEPTKPASDVARSATGPQSPRGPSPQSPAPSSPTDSDDASPDQDEDEEEEEEEDDVEEEEDEEGEEVEETVEALPTQDEVKPPCDIVDDLFKDDNTLKNACPTKYVNGREKFPNWKCVTPSGKPGDTGSSGATTGGLCIPPRRRRLYIQKLHDWADTVGNTATQVLDGTPSPSDKLRTAFIQSAAIETFFLWHKYKVDKAREKSEKQDGLVIDTSQLGKELQKDLENGTIPEEFLRQMFYTLGDYRDIFFGNNMGNGNDMKKVKSNIDKVFANGVQEREQWWKIIEKDVWHGMIYALTYNTDSGAKDKPPEVDQKVRAQLWDDNTKKPKNHDYNSVTLKDESSDTKPQTTSPASDNTPLTQFVVRPPYFRYLEEWGQNFCKERKKRLRKIRGECTDGGGNYTGRYCGGDGFDCTEKPPSEDNTFRGFQCPSCGEECRKYKKWIKKKKDEFEKQNKIYDEQKSVYGQQKGDAKNNSDPEFVGKLNSVYTSIGLFLNRLKNGPCKKDNDNGNNSGEDDIDFDKDSRTFQHAKDCAPCPAFGVQYKRNAWSNVQEDTCNDKTPITKHNIETMGKTTEKVDILVSDDSTKKFEVDDLKICEGKGIFKGFRKDVWECGYKCGYDVCRPIISDRTKDNEQNIQIRTLFKSWVENFVEDYIKIKRKFSHCTNNKNTSTCITGCKDKCKCVEEWIKLKQQEWPKIRERFNDQYKSKDSDDYNMRSFLETLIPQITDVNEKEKVIKISKFDNPCGCSFEANSQNKNGHKDAIDCMINRLQQKAKKCAEEHREPSGKETTCDEKSPHVGDDEEEPYEDLLLQETEEKPEEAKKKMMPTICEGVVPQEPEVDEDKCGEPDTSPPSTDTEGTSDGTEGEKDEKPADEPPLPPPPPAAPPRESKEKAKPPQKPRIKTRHVLDHPAVIPALVTSTLAWSVGIGFAAFTYFYLKKKTKSTIDLLRVINIPKSDYDIPTKLSPNRYIPYTSGKYRGKRYIYLEGDSGTDSGYTDHYSDITSSSESEYEELDINDIYVPGSPKYKTLIEVVLEPSGKLSGNTIPTSGNNTTASDTQNDIQNDGIPSSKITDNEWNTLKHEFISQYLQSEQPNDVPNDYTSGNSSTNTNITTTSRHNVEEKPFIMSIHDRNLLSGEEYNYDMSTNSGNNNLYSGENKVYGGIEPTSANHDSYSGKHGSYSGIDLINDSLSGDYDIYDEVLKRKENELFGTNHVKQTSIHSVAKPISDDPIHNQLELFHKWLDRHRDMCEKWENHHERLAKLKEEWENDTSTSGNTHPSDSNKTLNTEVSIQIDMDDGKPKKEFTNMDTILEDLDKYNEPYYDVQDDIYYDVHDHDASTVDSNNMDVPSKVQIEMDVNTKLVKEKYPIADVWDI